MLKSFRKIKTKDAELNRVQDALEPLINILPKIALLDGTLLVGLEVDTAEIRFPHTLQRPLQGFFVVDRDQDIRVWKTASDSLTMTLQANVAGTISLWIF
jgi:hypothetical protein